MIKLLEWLIYEIVQWNGMDLVYFEVCWDAYGLKACYICKRYIKYDIIMQYQTNSQGF